MSCNHKSVEYVEVRVERWCDIEREYATYIEEECQEVDLMEDIDTHRMRCSRCGEIQYYSGAAQNFYEKGIKSGVKGLE